MTPEPEPTEVQPGADRFWGQFSQSKAGRSNPGDGSSDEARSKSGNDDQNDGCLEWCPICRSAELFRHAVPPELRQQAESIQHEAIGVLKAFLDAYTDKAGPGHSTSGTTNPGPEQDEDPQSPKVTDIPLD